MNLVDSSGWLEYLVDGPNAPFFEAPLSRSSELIVPTICLYEVFKIALHERGENAAIQAAGLMRQARVVPLSESIALTAARFSLERKVPMADSIIAATGAEFGATIWTQDPDFRDLPGVKFIAKKS